MRRTAAAFLLLILASLAKPAPAQVRQFPYDARVETGSVLVRSGPGQKYYPTGRLNRGDRVTVIRHDIGGWYVIVPPAGSFSWIRADAVDRRDDHHGVLTDDNVIVRVGSALEDSRDVFQLRLSTGAAVEIIGEKTFSTESGWVRMYKITPPRGEWRWIPGHAVVPIDPTVRRQMDQDPYSVPSFARRPSEVSATKASSGPELKPDRPQTDKSKQSRRGAAANGGVRQSGPSPFDVSRDRRRLDALDERFREIIDQQMSQWEFSQLREEYIALQHEASHPAVASQIDLRLDAIERYERIKADYDGFIQLTSETQRRDAQLEALQDQKLQQAVGTSESPAAAPASRKQMPQAPVRGTGTGARYVVPQPRQRPSTPYPRYVVPRRQAPQPPTAPGNTYRPNNLRRTPVSASGLRSVPRPPYDFGRSSAVLPRQPSRRPRASWPRLPLGASRQNPNRPQAARMTAQPARMPAQSGSRPPMIAAGIVQRAIAPAPGSPAHVLLEPSGRILAYLQAAPGVDLEAHLGQSMGLFGRRTKSRDLQADVIIVSGLTPVRLQR